MESADATVIPYHKSNRGRSANASTKVPPQRKAGAAGRKAFQGDYCEIHGPADDGKGCAKFSHLDTTGRGLAHLPFYRTFLATFTRAIKPLFMALIAIGIFYIATHFVGRALHIGSGLPNTTDGRVPGSVRPSPSHGVSHRGIGPASITPVGDFHYAIPG